MEPLPIVAVAGLLALTAAQAVAQRVDVSDIKVFSNASCYRRGNASRPELGDLVVVPCKAKPQEEIIVAGYLYYARDDVVARFSSLRPAPAVAGLYRSVYPGLAGAAKADASYFRPDDRIGTEECAFSLFLPYSQIAPEAVGISGFYSWRVIVFKRESNNALTVLQDLTDVGGVRQQAITPYEYAGVLYRRVVGVAH